MPIIKSAQKQMRQNDTKRKRNSITKTKLKMSIKNFLSLVKEKKEEAQKFFPQVQKIIDLAIKKNLLHKNTGARKKSQLAKLLK